MKADRKRIMWVQPVFQSVYPRPFGNFLLMAIHAASTVGDRYAFAPHVPERQIIHGAMNKACQLLLANDFDAMIVGDDDCFPPYDAIARLLTHMENGYDLVAGTGYMRGFPHTTTAGRYYPEGATLTLDAMGQPSVTGFYWVEDLAAEANDLVPVDFCGMPIMLITKRAIQKIEAPWFGTNINGGDCTHDVYFGVKAKEAGLQIYVDRTMDCGHLLDPHIVTGVNRGIARGMENAWQRELAARRA